jgi:hypothetical protein
VREGEAKGEAKGKVEAILEVLKTRGVAAPPEVEQRIASCSDPELLSLWLKRAVTAIRADEVVAPTQASLTPKPSTWGPSCKRGSP